MAVIEPCEMIDRNVESAVLQGGSKLPTCMMSSAAAQLNQGEDRRPSVGGPSDCSAIEGF